MQQQLGPDLSRRQMLGHSAAAIGVAAMPTAVFGACTQPLKPTESTNFLEYRPGAPLRTSFLETDATGQRIRLSGRALTTNCEPAAGARLDFWHTDSNGIYDWNGYRFRGAQLIGADGEFQLDTVMPGHYGGIPRHVHFLLSYQPNNRPQPILVINQFNFPTREEDSPVWRGLDPDTLPRKDGVLIAHRDIVLDVA